MVIAQDYHMFTAGQYKRTVTVLAPVTDEGKGLHLAWS